MTLMQGPRLAATAPQDGKAAPGMSLATRKRSMWWLVGATLLGLAVLLGWGFNIADGTVANNANLGAVNKPRRIEPAKPAWSLSIDGQPSQLSAQVTASLAASPAVSLRNSGNSAESRLIAIYQLLRNGERATALAEAQRLSADYPNFQLARLLYADLLAVSANRPLNMGEMAPANSPQAKQLAALVQESTLRLQAITEVPQPGTLPSNFIALPPSTRNVIAVDASRARLYWFQNIAGPNEPSRMVLVKDIYMSVGKDGVDKFVEGDNRTPLGVYFITSILPGEKLPDLYGVGALPLNYPNALDLLRRKTGDGIWLHGTPSAQYARAPQASEGCVVLANPDMKQLLQEAHIRETPVLIAKSLTWVDASLASKPWAASDPGPTPAGIDGKTNGKSNAKPNNADFATSFAKWQHSRRTQDLPTLRGMYSDKFFRRGKGLGHWWPTIKREATRDSRQSDITVVSWQDQDQIMVVNYLDAAMRGQAPIKKRQYWRLEGDTWRIFYEGIA